MKKRMGVNIEKNGEIFQEILQERFPYIEQLESYKGFNKKIKFRCKECGSTFLSTPHYFMYHDSGCKICGDGISFPNKVIRALIECLNLDYYEFEYSPKWLNNRKMDCYFILRKIQYCVEMDGGFHFKDNTRSGQTKEEAQEIDREKQELCENHNIKVIRINCDYHRHEEIIESVKNSELKMLFNLNKINWLVLENIASQSLVIKVCNLVKENFNLTTKEIANYFKIDTSTVLHYIKFGKKINILPSNYIPLHKTYKPIKVEDLELNKIYYFNKTADFVYYAKKELKLFLNTSSIRASIKANRLYYNRFKIYYIDVSPCNFNYSLQEKRVYSEELFIEFCNFLKKNEKITLEDIDKRFNLCKQTAIQYLEKAKKLKLVPNDYSFVGKYEIDVYDLHNNFIGHFKTSGKCAEYFLQNFNIVLNEKGVSRAAKGERKTYKGYIFIYPNLKKFK